MDELEELVERLHNANVSLVRLADEYQTRAEKQRGVQAIDYWKHYDRLNAKAEGVRLAISYVEEILRRPLV